MTLLLRRLAGGAGDRGLAGGAGDRAPDETPDGLTAAADAARPPTVIDVRGHPRPPAMPEATGVYVVGDIHGELDSLQRVIQRIRTDLEANPVEHAMTVFLGDYVDRGMASKSVIDTIIAECGIGQKIALRGNHEEMLLRALDDPTCMRGWCEAGGIATLASYGVPVADLMRGRGHDAARAALLDAMPEHHRAWLRGLPSCYESGDYFFCHAGIDPDRPLEDQREGDLLWIRGKIISDHRSFAKIIVHGHSPVERIEVRHNRINLDTGAFCTGNLACIRLDKAGLHRL
jgi:serine/threonine protein phosphatase 1